MKLDPYPPDRLRQLGLASLDHLDHSQIDDGLDPGRIRDFVVEAVIEPSDFFGRIAPQDVSEHIAFLSGELRERLTILTAEERAEILARAITCAELDVITALADALEVTYRIWRKTFGSLFRFLDESDSPWAEAAAVEFWRKMQRLYLMHGMGTLNTRNAYVARLLSRQQELVDSWLASGARHNNEYPSADRLRQLFSSP